jgi:hypothetical protein
MQAHVVMLLLVMLFFDTLFVDMLFVVMLRVVLGQVAGGCWSCCWWFLVMFVGGYCWLFFGHVVHVKLFVVMLFATFLFSTLLLVLMFLVVDANQRRRRHSQATCLPETLDPKPTTTQVASASYLPGRDASLFIDRL